MTAIEQLAAALARVLHEAVATGGAMPRSAQPLMLPEELCQLTGLPKPTLYRLTKGQPWRVEYSRTDIRFEREGAIAWARTGGSEARPRRQRLKAAS